MRGERLLQLFAFLLIVGAYRSGVASSIALARLKFFASWNDVPTELPLGLLSDSAKIQTITLINGTCLSYLNNNTICKYYSDCCAMTPSRPAEQLAQDTFSCHDGYYIVDKCPASIEDVRLKDLCEAAPANSPTDISMSRWPVRGTTNHLLYKNIFCAICNGVDPSSDIQLSDQDLYDSANVETPAEPKNISLPIVEWLPATVQCETEAMRNYIENQPTRSKLIKLIQSRCTVHFFPPESPHICWDAIRLCPANSDEETRKLCQTGPANYIQITENDQIYRNQFCAICNGRKDFLSTSKPADLPAKEGAGPLQMVWKESKLIEYTEEDEHGFDLLMVARPMIDLSPVPLSLNSSKHNNFNSQIGITCSYFANTEYDFCVQDLVAQNISSNQSIPVWGLGSFTCYSAHPKICDQFVVLGGESTECTTPGCGKGYLQDPESSQCMNIKEFNITRHTKQNNLPWHSDVICQYQSRCKSVELGLMAEEELNCFCDEFCVYYNDCCVDSEYQSTSQNALDHSQNALDHGTFSCVNDNGKDNRRNAHNGRYFGVMQIDKCPKDYNNEEIARMCNEGTEFKESWNSSLVPVTDVHTGLRYANIHCAACHNITDFAFWNVEIGCLPVANDRCTQLLKRGGAKINTNFADIVRELRNNPSIDSLLRLRDEEWQGDTVCHLKHFTPPTSQTNYRRCRIDALNYISTCPESIKDWEISKRCESEPASFVYGDSSAGNLRTGTLSDSRYARRTWGALFYTIVFSEYFPQNKFRNSYCASCNSVSWQGCRVKSSYKIISGREEIFEQYITGPQNYMFIFKFDLTKRQCTRDSDAYLVHPNFETGYDTCQNLTNQLHQCDCQSFFNLKTRNCTLMLTLSNQTACKLSEERDIFLPPAYLQQCPSDFTYDVVPSREAESECLKCSARSLNKSGCHSVYTFAHNDAAEQFASIHCETSNKLLHCELTNATAAENPCVGGVLEDALSDPPVHPTQTTRVVLLNSVAISYKQITYQFKIKPTELMKAGFEFLFTTFIDGEGYCSSFVAIESEHSEFLVCSDGAIQTVASKIRYSEFLLQGDGIEVCTQRTLPGFIISIQDYVLSAISIMAAAGYVAYYFVKAKRTLTGHFVISALITLVLGLLSYCLTNSLRESHTACRVIASLTQYFLICTHSWTNALAIWMVRGITQTRLAARHGMKKYLKWAAYAWLTPVAFVILANALDTAQIVGLYPVYSPYLCFISDGWIRLLTFTGPIYVLILINVILCIFAIVKVTHSNKNLNTHDKKRTRKKIITVVKLEVVFGFHWFLLFFTEIDGPHTSGLWQTLSIFITLQGVNVVLTQLIRSDSCTRIKDTLTSLTKSTEVEEHHCSARSIPPHGLSTV